MSINKDGCREVSSHRRSGSCIRKPFRKMDISLGVKDGPERDPQETGDKEFLSHNIGEGNMLNLLRFNATPCVRFDPIGRVFNGMNDFVSQLMRLLGPPAK